MSPRDAGNRSRWLTHPIPIVDSVLLPTRCPICHALGEAPCHDCRADLRPPPALPVPTGVDRLAVLFAYEGAGRHLVTRLKYRNARSSLGWLAAALAEVAIGPNQPRPDVVTWVPTSPSRRRDRGFDQAELLARRLARRLRIPARRVLIHDAGDPQTGRSAAERWLGPPLGVRPRVRVPPRVLLVDDVVTTGATMAVAARALRQAGATSVTAVAAARTPLRSDATGPYTAACTARGSVVASRCQSQAKRPT